MDIEKLIELLSRYSEPVIAYKLDADFAAACMETANELAKIPSLQAENEKLRKELEWKDMVLELAQRKEREARAELEQVRVERNAYQAYFKDLSSKPDCNTCENRNCEYRPRIGATVRVNCPLYSGPEKED